MHAALWMKQFDGDVVEGGASVSAGNVGEVARGVAELAIGHYDAGFGFALDGVDDVSGAEADVKIGHVVLVEKRGVVGGDTDAEDADVLIFEDEMMMRLLGDGNGGGGLSVQSECKHK